MALEELEKELYKKEESEELKRRAARPEEKPAGPAPGVLPGWRREPRQSGVSAEYAGHGLQTWRNWVLGGALTALVILASVSGYFLYQAFTVRDIDLAVEVPGEVQLGKPFDVRVNFANQSDRILNDARVSLALPDGISFLGAPLDQRNEAREVGAIGIGSQSAQTFSLIVLRDPQSVKRIRAALSYAAIGGRSRFERGEDAELTVGGSAVQVDLRVPKSVFGGEEFETVVTYRNNSDIEFSNLELRLDMPPTYTFLGSTVPPDAGNSLWRIGSLLPGSEGEFAVRGSLLGPERSFFDIRTTLNTSFLGRTYTIEARSASLAISPSPLALTVLVNDRTELVARPGDVLRYELRFTNNTDIGLRDVVLRARLVGEMFDVATLQAPQISFSSLTNTLTWNAANTPQLAVLEAGRSGVVNFSVRVRSDYPIRRVNDKNFELRLEGTIESPTVPSFIAAEKTIGLSESIVKVAGQTAVDARVFFRDAASGIVNRGPIPPRVNQPTDFTVHWVVENYATDVEDVVIRANLEPGVRWTGEVKSNINTIPTFNERTGEVLWTIDRIPATRGVVSDPLEAIFQIEATPSVLQAGDHMPLISQTFLRARDAFVDEELLFVDSPVSTSLPDDPTVGGEDGVVVN